MIPNTPFPHMWRPQFSHMSGIEFFFSFVFSLNKEEVVARIKRMQETLKEKQAEREKRKEQREREQGKEQREREKRKEQREREQR